jgi:hypothetical protein
MSPGTRRAIVMLFALTVALSAAAILFTVTYYRAEQSAQRRQGELLEQKLCTSLDRLAALRPPPGSPGDNPSRAFEQQQHAVLAELGPDVGCAKAGRR